MNQLQPEPRAARTITNPPPGTADVFGEAILNVRGTMNAGEIVVAQAYPKGSEPAPNDPPNLATAAVCFVHGGSFFRGAVPGAVAGDDGAFILVAWSSPNLVTPIWTQFPQVEYTPNPISQFTIEAQRSLYFAWAPDPSINQQLQGPAVPGRQFPSARENGHDCRPLELHIPASATSVQLQVLRGAWWNSTGSGQTCDADGRAGTSATTRAEYRQDEYRSSHIPSLTTNLNKLVGLWGPMNPPSGAINSSWLLEIGMSNPTLTVPTSPRPESLFLGMHDGFEWNNNPGDMVVQVTLS